MKTFLDMCRDVIAITTAGLGVANLNFAVSVVGLGLGLER